MEWLNLLKPMKTRNNEKSHQLLGGDVKNVTNGLIFAKAAGIPLTFKEASQMDLAEKRHNKRVEEIVIPGRIE